MKGPEISYQELEKGLRVIITAYSSKFAKHVDIYCVVYAVLDNEVSFVHNNLTTNELSMFSAFLTPKHKLVDDRHVEVKVFKSLEVK